MARPAAKSRLSRAGRWRLAALLGTAIVAGCAGVPHLAAGGTAPTGVVQIRLAVPGAAGYRILGGSAPFRAADIKAIQVGLYLAGTDQVVVTDGATASVELGTGHFGDTLTFSHLRRNTTYRIKAFAYQDPGCCLPADLISDDSHLDVAVAGDDRPTLASLTLKLVGATFAGEATASLALTEGRVVTTGDPGMAVASPTPTPGT